MRFSIIHNYQNFICSFDNIFFALKSIALKFGRYFEFLSISAGEDHRKDIAAFDKSDCLCQTYYAFPI